MSNLPLLIEDETTEEWASRPGDAAGPGVANSTHSSVKNQLPSHPRLWNFFYFPQAPQYEHLRHTQQFYKIMGSGGGLVPTVLLCITRTRV